MPLCPREGPTFMYPVVGNGSVNDSVLDESIPRICQRKNKVVGHSSLRVLRRESRVCSYR